MEKEKKFKLLKDIPDAKAGTILTYSELHGAYIYGDDYEYRAKDVENNPEWFEEVEEEFEVGDWTYWKKEWSQSKNHLARLIEEDKTEWKVELTSGYKTHGSKSYLRRLATKEEIEACLTVEAKKRDYEKNSFNPIRSSSIWKVGSKVEYRYNSKYDELELWSTNPTSDGGSYVSNDRGYLTIYQEGQWAEVVEDRPKFKVGDYVRHQSYKDILLRVEEIKNNIYFTSTIPLCSTTNAGLHSDEFRVDLCALVTDEEEIESFLIREAEKRGFEDGVRYKTRENSVYTFNPSIQWRYEPGIDALGRHGLGWIYEKGQWAEIIKKKPLKIGDYEVKLATNGIGIGCKTISYEEFGIFCDIINRLEISEIKSSYHDTTATRGQINEIRDAIKQL